MWWYFFLSVSIILFAAYAAILLLYKKWFLKLQPFTISTTYASFTRFSIIIPARNEASNIEACLKSIFNQHYPENLFEVIVIDDYSTDATPLLVETLQQKYSNLTLIKLADVLAQQPINSYKKKAIELAIGIAKHEWVVTTDADCFVNENWLQVYDAYIQKESPVFVAAPVKFTNDESVLQSFQCIDFMALQGITAAAVSAGFHAMCNGANVAYSKAAFTAVHGFKDIDNIASGDDMLLMSKIKLAFPNKIGFVYHTDAVVQTAPMNTWKGFINQRIRWASKANAYKDKSVFWVLLIIYLCNVSLLVMPLIGIFKVYFIICWMMLLLLKTIIEASFAFHIAKFFNIRLKWWFIYLQVPHIVYTVIAGWLGLFGKYQWKGRHVK